MLYNLLFSKFETNPNLSFLMDVNFRALVAFFVALIISLAFGSKLINFLRHKQGKGQPIREDGPQTHLLTKKGTPTMGGLLILGSSIIATLLCASLTNPFVWICILVLMVYGITGFVDDYVKVTKQTANAMTAKMKLFLQFATSLIAVLVISHYTPAEFRYSVNIPYFKDVAIDLWLFYVPFAMVVIVGSSNAVNLSDGLDGLATGLCVAAFFVFMILAYIYSGDVYYAVHPIPMVGDVAVVCAAVIGGCVGFLWFNASPAQVFMGDTGSLALGALLGTVAVMVKNEIVLAIVGGVFVVEALSVMIQVFWYKRTKNRVFLMAPIHHHFEQLGWKETTVVARFWIVGFILAIVGLISLMTRY